MKVAGIIFVWLTRYSKQKSMAKPNLKKLKKKSTWKPVEIAGNLISGADDFEGFAGLEVLENYDDSFLSGDSKKRKVCF